jgi:hypothetical protein
MPAFPTINYAIPNPVGMPGWIASMIAYYGDVANFPYHNPPKEPIITFGIPNVLLFPLYLLHLFLWCMGWAGAIFEYVIIYIADIIGNVIMYVINVIADVFTGTLEKTREATAGMGIFAIPIQIAILGILLTLLVMIAFGVAKGAEKIGGMLA